jgi:hypothetical protein
MEETILRSEVLKQADTGDPFDMVLVTCDRKRGTGGELLSVKQWAKMHNIEVAEKMPGTIRKTARAMVKNPHHWVNKTLNIFNPNNKTLHPIKVHFRLIQFFNNKRVING